MCPECFANGKETVHHRNTHSYIVRHDYIEIFPNTNWKLSDERKLLELLVTWGYGNWEDISRAMQFKFTPDECREHYHSCYFGGIFEKRLGLSKEYYFPERIPYLFKMTSIDPPRFDKTDTINFNNMAGYRCARGDFDIPYDKSAESIISNIDMKEYDNLADRKWFKKFNQIEDDLKCAVFQAYNNRIR